MNNLKTRVQEINSQIDVLEEELYQLRKQISQQEGQEIPISEEFKLTVWKVIASNVLVATKGKEGLAHKFQKDDHYRVHLNDKIALQFSDWDIYIEASNAQDMLEFLSEHKLNIDLMTIKSRINEAEKDIVRLKDILNDFLKFSSPEKYLLS